MVDVADSAYPSHRTVRPVQASLWPDETEPQPSLPRADSLTDVLDRVDWSFASASSPTLTHDLHPWPAKFTPALARTVIEALTRPKEIVLDPFCGCGTTAVESAALGRGFVAADLNPLAVRITEGKCEVPSTSERLGILSWSRGLGIETSSQLLDLAPPIPNRDSWFDDEVSIQLAYLLREIRELDTASAFLETVFSSIIVGVSKQESETRYRRVPRTITASEVLLRFQRRLQQALVRAAELPAGQSEPRRYCVIDARCLGEVDIPTAHLALFSPPYPNSFDYHLYHRFRMFWLGFDPVKVKHSEIGAHLRYQPDHTDWLDDMRRAFEGLRTRLRPGALVVCVVGDGIARGRRILSGELLWDRAPQWGFEQVWRTKRPVAKHRRAFNLADARLREEDVLVLRR